MRGVMMLNVPQIEVTDPLKRGLLVARCRVVRVDVEQQKDHK